MIAGRLMDQCAEILEVNQADGTRTVYIDEIWCSLPGAFDFRYAIADSNYDAQSMECYTHVPRKAIKEGMRIRYNEDEEFRIQSITKWPRVNPEYYTLRLQGDGHG